MLEKEINGCRIILSFSAKPVDGVIEKIQSILSSAYVERVQNEMASIVDLRVLCEK